MYKDEVLISEFGEIAGDAATDVVRILVILEVFVICEDSDRKCSSCKEVTPVVKTSYDSKEFSIMYIVVVLRF